MSKILISGDVHCKPAIIAEAMKLADQYEVDKVVFLGDFFDDWGATAALNADTIDAAQTACKSDDRVVLLYGNHEISYHLQQRCSGYNVETQLEAYAEVFREDFWQLSFSADNWLYTHAGLCTGFAKWQDIDTTKSAADVSEQLNKLWEDNHGIFKTVGEARGGWSQRPSPLWADWNELTANLPKGLKQIVGHTPTVSVDHNIYKEDKDTEVWNIDSWSNGGYGSFLLMEDGKPTLIKGYNGIEELESRHAMSEFDIAPTSAKSVN
jgi:hypothetical protein